ncbi:MAG: NAD(P)H-quinone oxidoreductase [Acidobacteria bacterium]|nr:NAD(P)H-quinone oxidoreductase [Acidobacteriota bacterium]
MIAIEITRPGDPDVLVAKDRPRPAPGPNEVLIEVAAAGVNRPDLMQRQGKYPPPPGASEIPGLEVAGTIVAVGSRTKASTDANAAAAPPRWRAGDQVCALVAGGGYAEYCVAPAPQCLSVPRGLDLVAAAGIPETFFTVWTNVFERGRLVRGETLLVHGGASGIGTTAIQLGRAFGARVFATAGGPDKCAACERLGAERAIDYRAEDFVEVVTALTGGRGVDVVLDMVGADYAPRNLDVLATDGRLIQIAFLHGPTATINLTPLLRRRLTITGSTLRPRSVAEKAAIARALGAQVWPLLESGAVRPIVHATFPLARAADAHRLMEAGTHIGKIVLVARPSALGSKV